MFCVGVVDIADGYCHPFDSSGRAPGVLAGRLGMKGKCSKKLNERRMGEFGCDSFGSVWSQVAGSCDHGNEPSSSLNWEEFLRFLRLLKKGSFM